jgi:hypothetical protein
VLDRGQTPAEALADLRPELVVVRGRVMMASNRFAAQACPRFKDLEPIHIEGRGTFLIRAGVPRLYAAASAAIGPELRLAGKRICL